MVGNYIVGVNITHGAGDGETKVIFMRVCDSRFYPLHRTQQLLNVFNIYYVWGTPIVDRTAIDIPLVF